MRFGILPGRPASCTAWFRCTRRRPLRRRWQQQPASAGTPAPGLPFAAWRACAGQLDRRGRQLTEHEADGLWVSVVLNSEQSGSSSRDLAAQKQKEPCCPPTSRPQRPTPPLSPQVLQAGACGRAHPRPPAAKTAGRMGHAPLTEGRAKRRMEGFIASQASLPCAICGSKVCRASGRAGQAPRRHAASKGGVAPPSAGPQARERHVLQTDCSLEGGV